MAVQSFPPELTLANWLESKAVDASAKPPKIGEALKALQKLHESVDWNGLDAKAVKSLAEAEQREADAARMLGPLLGHAKTLNEIAARWAADLAKDKKTAKPVLLWVAGVCKEARDYGSALSQAQASAQAALTAAKARLAAADKAREASAGAADAKAQVVAKKVLNALRLVKTQDPEAAPMQFVAAVAVTTSRVFLAKAVGPAHRPVLAPLLAGQGLLKYVLGECRFEKNAYTFITDDQPSGLQKKLVLGLFELTGQRFKVRVRDPAGKIVSEDDDEDKAVVGAAGRGAAKEASAGAPGGTPPPGGAAVRPSPAEVADGAALMALGLRLKVIRAEIEGAQLGDGPMAKDLAARVEAVLAALKARKAPLATTLLEALAPLVKAALAHLTAAREAALVAALATRSAALKAAVAELERLNAKALPVAAQMQAAAAAAVKAIHDRKPEAADPPIAALAQIAKAVAARKAGGDATVGKVQDDARKAFEAAQAGVATERAAAQAVADKPPTPELAEWVGKFKAAREAVNEAVAAKAWSVASAALPALKAAALALEASARAWVAYDKLERPVGVKATQAAGVSATPAVPPQQTLAFTRARAALRAAAKAGDWAGAALLLPAVDLASQAVLDSVAGHKAYAAARLRSQAREDLADSVPDEALTAVLRQSYLAAKADLQAAVAARDWALASTRLADLDALARAVGKAGDDHAQYGADYAGFSDEVVQAWNAAAAPPGVPAAEKAALDTAWDAVCRATEAFDWATATARLAALEAATHTILDTLQKGAKFYAAFARIQAAHAAAKQTGPDDRKAVPEDVLTGFDAADQAMAAAVEAKDWAAAQKQLAALTPLCAAFKKAIAAKADYDAAYRAVSHDLVEAWNASRALGIPTGERKALFAAWDDVCVSTNARKWAEAETKLIALDIASQTVLSSKLAGQAFQSAFAKIKTEFDAAVKAAQQPGNWLDLPKTRFANARKATDAAVDAGRLALAGTSLAAVKAAALELTKAAEDHADARLPFDAEFAALTGLADARAIIAAPGAPLKQAEREAFRVTYLAVNDPRNAGDFAAARAGLPALQDAIDALIAADETCQIAKLTYELDLDAVVDLAVARTLAAAPPAALKAEAAALTQAQAVVDAAVKLEDWAKAKQAVAPLKAAAVALLAARTKFNEGVKPTDIVDLNARVKAIKDKLYQAAKGTLPGFVAELQSKALDHLSVVEGRAAAHDHAGVEAGLASLAVEVEAMVQGRLEHTQAMKAYDAAKAGAVQAALDVKAPDALAKARKDALAKSAKAVLDLIDRGRHAKATARIAAWIAEAKAWLGAQAAFDSMASGKPDPAVLKQLADDPAGGPRVLDALVAALPPETPQQVHKDALEARFGFAIQHFKKKNETLEDLSGLDTADPTDQADKSFQQVYAMLCKVPQGNVKGKVAEWIQFDASESGAAYTPRVKKVWMYCGRGGDAKGAQQEFNKVDDVVPEGEAVDLDCQPEDATPLPYFDFATIHEVGHAVDDDSGFMGKGGSAHAGWEEHSADEVAAIVAAHFGYDEGYVKATLATKNSTPPAPVKPPDPLEKAEWEAAQKKVDAWCQSVREGNGLWWKAGLSKQHAIGKRVYHEAYEGRPWVSYLYAARAQGITGYQFRAPGEWFAELYAAYFAKRLKKTHPAVDWLKTFKSYA